MPTNCRTCISVLGTGHDWTASVFSGSHAIPSLLTMCPRYFMDLRNQAHLLAFNFRLAAFSLCMTHFKLPRVSLNVLPKMIISSRYTKHLSHWRPLNTVSMSLWNVAGAPESPNGITRNWNRPLRVMNAVLGLSSSFIFTCQYPEARSKVQNHSAPPSVLNVSSIRGRGYASFRDRLFNSLKSTQKRMESSFLVTRTVGKPKDYC